jgi:hypothetical protein
VVRRIYGRFLRLAAACGVARRASETPLEFSTRLQLSYPESEGAALLLTQAYNKVRYGEFSDEEIDLTGVRGSWQHLRTQVMHKRAAPGNAEEAGRIEVGDESG